MVWGGGVQHRLDLPGVEHQAWTAATDPVRDRETAGAISQGVDDVPPTLPADRRLARASSSTTVKTTRICRSERDVFQHERDDVAGVPVGSTFA
jgi:hypothetical protein